MVQRQMTGLVACLGGYPMYAAISLIIDKQAPPVNIEVTFR
jgi:hypothetical protein